MALAGVRRRFATLVRGFELARLLLTVCVMKRFFLSLLWISAWASSAAAATAAPEKQVVVIVGLPGAGKSTIAREMAEALSLPAPLSAGDVIRAEVRARGLPYTPDSERQVALEFERKPGAIARAISQQLSAVPGEVAVVEGLRSPAELSRLRRDKRFAITVVSAEAPAMVRHARMLTRDGERYANVDPATHRIYLQQRDEDEIGRGVGRLLERADLRVDTSGSTEETRQRVLDLAARFARSPAALEPLVKRAARAIPAAELRVMARNPFVHLYLADTLSALAEIAPADGARGLVARLARARNSGDAAGASYEAWVARSMGDRLRAVAVSHEGNEVDLLLKDGSVGEAKAGRPSDDVLRQLSARAKTGRPVLLFTGQDPGSDWLQWFAETAVPALPGGVRVVHLPFGGKARHLLRAPARVSAPTHSPSEKILRPSAKPSRQGVHVQRGHI